MDIIYLAPYFGEKPAPDLKEMMLSDFYHQFSVSRNVLHRSELAVDRFAGPVYTTGFADRILAYEEHELYLDGMFSPPNYPERSMEGSTIAD